MQGLLLQVEVAEIVVHEACEPNALVDLLDAGSLASQHGGDADPLAMQAEASASGDENVAVVERIGQFRQTIMGGVARRWKLAQDLPEGHTQAEAPCR